VSALGPTFGDIVAFGGGAFVLAPMCARLGFRWYAGASILAVVATLSLWFGSGLGTRTMVPIIAASAGLVVVGFGLQVMTHVVDREDATRPFRFVLALAAAAGLLFVVLGHLTPRHVAAQANAAPHIAR
jgi:hypothetical protein